jgi:hypothetical protein
VVGVSIGIDQAAADLRAAVARYDETGKWWTAVTRTAEEERRAESVQECLAYSERLEGHAHALSHQAEKLLEELADVEVFVGVIEWDSSESPSLYVGASWMDVAVPVAQAIADSYPGEAPDDLGPFRAEQPLTPEILAEEDRLADWLAGVHEATTVPWHTIENRRIRGLAARAEAPAAI